MTPEHPHKSIAEEILWQGHTSQWVHFGYYFLCVILAIAALVGIPFTAGLSAVGLILPLVLWGIRWWMTRTTTYELTTQRLRIRSGILSKHLDELELYRVKDYAMAQPLHLRIFKLGTLTLFTSDVSTPTVMIKAIHGVEDVREKIRTAVQSERDRKRVREMDIDGTGDFQP